MLDLVVANERAGVTMAGEYTSLEVNVWQIKAENTRLQPEDVGSLSTNGRICASMSGITHAGASPNAPQNKAR